MNLRPRRVEDPEINLVSLIDVVLMMVVFFMLSSSLVDEGRIRVHLPQARDVPTGKPPVEPLVVSVTQQGSYLVNGHELINSSPDTLRAALLKEAGTDRTMRVTLRADGRTTHQSVITAMDVLGRLGFVELNIATVRQDVAPAADTK
ncbi:MAG TPA: biopolymer transporter ExbD [Steroidobacteraceae bacterium]|nr:biopolymer transporter ExbD [Steroidobacteraceae bacterium]